MSDAPHERDAGLEPALERDPAAAHERRGRGCLFWFVLVVFLLVLIVGGCFGFAYWWFYRSLYPLTDPAPAAVATYTPAPGELEALENRLGALGRGDQAVGREIVLTAADLNALCSRREARGAAAGKVFFRIEGRQLAADVSWPLDDLPGFRGRHLNATVECSLAVVDGQVELHIDQARTPRGADLPRRLLDLTEAAFARILRSVEDQVDPDHGLAKVRELTVADGRIVIRT